MEAVAANGGAGAGVEADPELPPAAYLEFKAMYEKEGKAFLAECANIGYPDVENLTRIVSQAFETIMKYLALQNKIKKPTMQECVAFNQPMLDAMNDANGLVRTRNKALFKFDNVHKALYEMIQSCTFVSMYPPQLPASHCKGQMEAADFSLTKIMMKEQDKRPFAKAAKAFLAAQADIVKAHYKCGIEFGGQDNIADMDPNAPAPKTAEPAQKEEEVQAKEPTKPVKTKEVDGQALFSALNKGLSATSGLKKVKKAQKNKYNRANIKGTVSGGHKKAKAKKKMPDPKKYKQGPFTWFYQYYQDGLTEIGEEDKLTIKNGLYICNSMNCQFRITSKVKSVVIDSCQRVQLEIHDVVSAIELVNCKNVTIWCMGQVPSVTIDKSESPKIVFNDTAWVNPDTGKNPQVIYSNVTAGNIEIPGATQDDDRKEYPLVEQFEFKIRDGHAKYSPLDHGD